MSRAGRWVLLWSLPLLVCGCDESPGSSSSFVASDRAERTGDEAATGHSTETQAKAARADRIKEAMFDDIKFEMEKTDPFQREMLTPKIEKMFGKRIRLRGWMLPTHREHGLKEFVLVRDNLECCFGPGAALFDCVFVHMEEGATASYTTRQIAVEGRFRFEELLDPVNGNHLAIYALDGEKVK